MEAQHMIVKYSVICLTVCLIFACVVYGCISKQDTYEELKVNY